MNISSLVDTPLLEIQLQERWLFSKAHFSLLSNIQGSIGHPNLHSYVRRWSGIMQKGLKWVSHHPVGEQLWLVAFDCSALWYSSEIVLLKILYFWIVLPLLSKEYLFYESSIVLHSQHSRVQYLPMVVDTKWNATSLDGFWSFNTTDEFWCYFSNVNAHARSFTSTV